MHRPTRVLANRVSEWTASARRAARRLSRLRLTAPCRKLRARARARTRTHMHACTHTHTHTHARTHTHTDIQPLLWRFAARAQRGLSRPSCARGGREATALPCAPEAEVAAPLRPHALNRRGRRPPVLLLRPCVRACVRACARMGVCAHAHVGAGVQECACECMRAHSCMRAHQHSSREALPPRICASSAAPTPNLPLTAQCHWIEHTIPYHTRVLTVRRAALRSTHSVLRCNQSATHCFRRHEWPGREWFRL